MTLKDNDTSIINWLTVSDIHWVSIDDFREFMHNEPVNHDMVTAQNRIREYLLNCGQNSDSGTHLNSGVRLLVQAKSYDNVMRKWVTSVSADLFVTQNYVGGDLQPLIENYWVSVNPAWEMQAIAFVSGVDFSLIASV